MKSIQIKHSLIDNEAKKERYTHRSKFDSNTRPVFIHSVSFWESLVGRDKNVRSLLILLSISKMKKKTYTKFVYLYTLTLYIKLNK